MSRVPVTRVPQPAVSYRAGPARQPGEFAFLPELFDGTKVSARQRSRRTSPVKPIPLTKVNLENIAQELPGREIVDYLAISAYLNEKFRPINPRWPRWKPRS